jgi:hypothetical protein
MPKKIEMTEAEKTEFVYNWIEAQFTKTRSEIIIFSELPGRMRYSIVPNPFATERAKQQTTPTSREIGTGSPKEGDKPKQ